MSGKPSSPLVAVVVPARGRVELLAETLDSLAGQTFAAWEAVVVDDDPAGAERSALRRAARRDPRVRILAREEEPAGAPACRNLGVAATTAPFVVFLDSDDLLLPAALEQRVELLERDSKFDFVVRAGEVFDVRLGDVGVPWNDLEGGDDLDRFLANDTPWQTSGPLWRRQALQRVGRWDEAALSWQDWDYHVRALAAGLRYAKDPVVDYCHRRARAGSMSQRHDDRDVLVARTRTFAAAHAALVRAGRLSARRRRLLRGLFLRFALKTARLHTDRAAGHAILDAAAATGLVSRERLASARALVDAAAAGAGGEECPAAIAVFGELAAVCLSAGRRRARDTPARDTEPAWARRRRGPS